MFLSVIILFTDYDYMLLDKAINSIKEHIKFNDYEIIAVDNREQNRSFLSIPGVKIITQGKNLYTFEGRRFGFKHASGKYIWNFDADDLMIEDLYLEDFPEEEKDFIQFNYTFNDKNKKEVEFNQHPYRYGNNVWSRFYNKSILEKVYLKLEKEICVPKFEDKILLDLVWYFKPSYCYINKRIYQYNILGSTTDKRLKNNVKKLGFEGYYYAYGLIGKQNFAKSLENIITCIIEIEERKCRNLKENKNIASQKS